MFKNKKWLVLLSVLMILGLLMAACQPPPVEEEPTEEMMEETEEPTEEPTPVPEETEEVEETEEATEEPTEEPMEDRFGLAQCEEDLTGETITYYQQAGLTGPLSQILGQGFINGNKDAVQLINDAGGICGATVEIELVDTQYDPTQELAAYEQFRDNDPNMMFTFTYGSPASVALNPLVNEDHIVNIAAGLNAEAFYIPRNGYTVGSAPIYSDQFAGFLQFLTDNWADVKPEGAGDEIVVGVIGWEGSFGAGATTPEALAFAEDIGVTVLPLETVPVDPAADVSGQVQNVVLGGANVIYVQSLSFGPAQVIGTVRALELWDSVIVGGVNWSMNQDVVNILGENAAAMNGYYGVFPGLWWNDVDVEGTQLALEAFEAGGYPESQKDIGYLLSFGEIFGVSDIVKHAIEMVGYENLNGEAFMAAFQDLGLVDCAGLFELDARGETRSPGRAQIRQAQVNADGVIEFVVIKDWFDLPNTRPPAE